MSKGEFVVDWVKGLKFKADPFENVKNPERYISGYEKEKQKINLFILEKYKFGTISGDPGFGKTVMLNWIDAKLDRHRNKIKVAYINSAELSTERDLIEALVDPLLNVVDKVKKVQQKLRLEELGKFLHAKLRGGKHMLILIDDVGKIPKRYISLFKYFFNKKINIQVIATGTSSDIIT